MADIMLRIGVFTLVNVRMNPEVLAVGKYLLLIFTFLCNLPYLVVY